MARRGKAYSGRMRVVDDTDAERRFEQSLSLIEEFSDAIDDGRNAMALHLSVELSNVLTGDGFSTRKRGTVLFPSPARIDRPEMMTAFHRLTGVSLGGTPLRGNFTIYAALGAPDGWNTLKFVDWWNETVYRASNARPGMLPGVVALRPEDQVPFSRRERLSRRLVVRTLRDHSAAHHLSQYPVVFDEIDSPSSWGGFGCQEPDTGKRYSTHDGSLEWGRGQLAAMIRQIGEETLVAFGRRPIKPNSD